MGNWGKYREINKARHTGDKTREERAPVQEHTFLLGEKIKLRGQGQEEVILIIGLLPRPTGGGECTWQPVWGCEKLGSRSAHVRSPRVARPSTWAEHKSPLLSSSLPPVTPPPPLHTFPQLWGTSGLPGNKQPNCSPVMLELKSPAGLSPSSIVVGVTRVWGRRGAVLERSRWWRWAAQRDPGQKRPRNRETEGLADEWSANGQREIEA